MLKISRWFKGFHLRRKLVKLWRCFRRTSRRPFRYHRRLIHNSTGREGAGTVINQRRNQLSIPKGHLTVYVGGVKDADHRFSLPVVYVDHPYFRRLLSEAEQAYGFHQTGGITIPCGVSDFESVKKQIAEDSDHRYGNHCNKGNIFQRLMYHYEHLIILDRFS